MTRFWSQCLPNEAANMCFTISSYGSVLKANKELLRQAMQAQATPDHLQALMLAMASVETTTMSSADRDASKDNTTDGSANVSQFNLSIDLVRCIDASVDPWSLNDPANMQALVRLIQQGLQRWGIPSYLNFVRGGRAAFQDGESYGAAEYRNTVATILRLFDRFPDLLTDDRRVNVSLVHV